MLDSGTTFNYLPRPAFRALLQALNRALQGSQLVQVSGADPSVSKELVTVAWEGMGAAERGRRAAREEEGPGVGWCVVVGRGAAGPMCYQFIRACGLCFCTHTRRCVCARPPKACHAVPCTAVHAACRSKTCAGAAPPPTGTIWASSSPPSTCTWTVAWCCTCRPSDTCSCCARAPTAWVRGARAGGRGPWGVG